MKKLLIICILIIGIVFISGCTSDEQANSEISTSSQSNQESDTQNPELIIKQSDVPGLTLMSYSYYAVPKSTPSYGIDDLKDIVYLNIDEINLTIAYTIFLLPTAGYQKSQTYDDVLPIGTKNIGQYSIWRDESGREVKVQLINFDSSNSFYKYYAEACDVIVDHANQNPQESSIDYYRNMVDLSIGDYCYYVTNQNQYNADVQETNLLLLCNNNYVTISVKDETSESVNEAIRIAKKIAAAKFAAHPARETKIISLLGFLKLLGLIGTGFAPPITNPIVRYAKIGIIMVMNRSICGRGLSVSLPILCAVGSPHL